MLWMLENYLESSLTGNTFWLRKILKKVSVFIDNCENIFHIFATNLKVKVITSFSEICSDCNVVTKRSKLEIQLNWTIWPQSIFILMVTKYGHHFYKHKLKKQNVMCNTCNACHAEIVKIIIKICNVYHWFLDPT